ncbi:hypothetical protein VB779_06730 [Haloarculaceae archaeon H-GB11]|nr:hypothetical protein [Haloarculaceae archaeon H-GB11]
MMGYDPAPQSDILEYLSNESELVDEILEACADEDALSEFAEEVLVHSVEHALSTWTTEEALASGSFELWYDVNFQSRDDQTATIGIYDSIQGVPESRRKSMSICQRTRLQESTAEVHGNLPVIRQRPTRR